MFYPFARQLAHVFVSFAVVTASCIPLGLLRDPRGRDSICMEREADGSDRVIYAQPLRESPHYHLGLVRAGSTRNFISELLLRLPQTH